MKTILGFFATLFGSVLSGLAIIFGVIVIFLTAVNLTVFNPNYYKVVLSGTYERLPYLIATETTAIRDYRPKNIEEGGSGQSELSGAPAMFTNLLPANWEKLVTTIAPASWLKAQTGSVLDQFFVNIDNFPKVAKPVTISLVELKSRLLGKAGLEVIRTLIGSLSPCSVNEENYWLGRPEQTILTCKPSVMRLVADQSIIKSKINSVFGSLPDTTTIKSLTLSPNQLRPLYLAKQLPLFGLLSEFLLFGLIAAFKVRDRKSLARWIGAPLLVTGAVGLLVGLSIVLLLPGVAQVQLTPRLPEYWSSELVTAVFVLMRLFLQLFGGVVSLISAGTIVLSIIIKRYNKPK